MMWLINIEFTGIARLAEEYSAPPSQASVGTNCLWLMQGYFCSAATVGPNALVRLWLAWTAFDVCVCVWDQMTLTSVSIKGQSDLWRWQAYGCDILLSMPQGQEEGRVTCTGGEGGRDGGRERQDSSKKALETEERRRGVSCRGLREEGSRVIDKGIVSCHHCFVSQFLCYM